MPTMPIKMDELISIVKAAGALVMQYYVRTDVEVTYKSAGSPVTAADIASQEVLMKALEKTKVPILSEELHDEDDRFSSDWVWLIDPIDGTKRFVAKSGEFCVMVALIYKHQPVMSCMYQPVTDTVYYAQLGAGAFKLSHEAGLSQLQVSTRSGADIVVAVSPDITEAGEHALTAKFGVSHFIKSGSAGLKQVLVAEGLADAYVVTANETGEWDSAAGALIITEAGGKVTDVLGEPLLFNKQMAVNEAGWVMTNGVCHDEVLAKVRS